MKFLFLISLIVLLNACTSWVSKPTEQLLMAPPPPPVVAKPRVMVVPPPEKEPGTLWTENSRWNEVYAISQTKKNGDIVFIKPSEEFRNLVASYGGKMPIRKSENPNVPVEVIPIVTTIREVLPRNIFRISGQTNSLVVDGETDVRFVAKIRERDIAEDDSMNTDLMFDLSFEVINPPPPKEEQDAQKGPPKKNKQPVPPQPPKKEQAKVAANDSTAKDSKNETTK